MLAAVRTGAWEKSGDSVLTASDYVQDGLIAMWDGIENAGFDSHVDTFASWKDLSPNGYDIPMHNHIVMSDGLDLTNSGFGSVDIPNASYDSLTLSVVFKCTSFTGNRSLFEFRPQGTSYAAILPFEQNNGFMAYGITRNAGKVVPYTSDRLAMTMTCSPTEVKAYLNGVLFSSVSGVFAAKTLGRLMINNYSNVHGNYIINHARAYGLAMTQDLILNDYAIDKARFNST